MWSDVYNGRLIPTNRPLSGETHAAAPMTDEIAPNSKETSDGLLMFLLNRKDYKYFLL